MQKLLVLNQEEINAELKELRYMFDSSKDEDRKLIFSMQIKIYENLISRGTSGEEIFKAAREKIPEREEQGWRLGGGQLYNDYEHYLTNRKQ